MQVAYELNIPSVDEFIQMFTIQSTQIVQLLMIGIGIGLMAFLLYWILAFVAITFATIITFVMTTLITILGSIFFILLILVNASSVILIPLFLMVLYVVDIALGLAGIALIV